jgi:hypothetical protein
MMVALRMVFGQNCGMTFLSITAAALLLLSSDPVSSNPLSGDDQSGEAVPIDDAPVDDVSGETDLSDPVAGDAVSGDAGGIDASTGADAEASYSASAAPSRAAAPAEEDPIAAAASGLVAQIEDDNNPGGDLRLVSMKTNGCTTIITASGIGSTGDDVNGEVDAMAENASDDAASNSAASGRTWTIDWAVPGSLSPADTFIFIEVAPVKIAIVGDASKPDQAAKLSALFAAMFETQLDCSTQF